MCKVWDYAGTYIWNTCLKYKHDSVADSENIYLVPDNQDPIELGVPIVSCNIGVNVLQY